MPDMAKVIGCKRGKEKALPPLPLGEVSRSDGGVWCELQKPLRQPAAATSPEGEEPHFS